MQVHIFFAHIVGIGVLSVIAHLSGIENIDAYFSSICKEIQDLDYKIAESLHFMEDGYTIFPNIREYNAKVKNVTQHLDGYYDVFAKYENLVLERGPKRWFPVHFVEDVAQERFNWTFKDFQTLKDLFKNSQNIFLNIKTKCKKWRAVNDRPINIWPS